MVSLTEDKYALVKNGLLHLTFGNVRTHTVNTPPNIQTLKGATTHYSTWQETLSPHLTAAGSRMV
jgi:hypothetical protein